MASRRMIFGSDGGGAPNLATTVLYPRVYSTEQFDSVFLSGSSQSFMGSRSMLSLEDVSGSKSSKRPFFRLFDGNNIINDEYDEYLNQPEKKRRLTVDQIQFLEKSFETDNKLEPERKVQLAKDLGLHPRQVAIWFQNRRARWKTKQMEKDYDALLSSYNSLKADYEGLLKEKEKLNVEVFHLSEKLLLQPNEKTDLAQSDTNKPPKSPQQGPTVESASEGEALKNLAEGYKLKDISTNFSLVEAGDMSYVYEPEQSDLSQDEEDNLSKNMLGPSVCVFPKMEDDEPTFSCYYEFPVEDQGIENWPF